MRWVDPDVIIFKTILKCACRYYNISYKVASSRCCGRSKFLQRARYMAFYLGNYVYEVPLTKIGKFVGNHHSAIIYGRNKMKSKINSDFYYSNDCRMLRAEIIKCLNHQLPLNNLQTVLKMESKKH